MCQIPDRLDQKDDGEKQHADKHDLGKGGRLFLGAAHRGKTERFDISPDANGEENDGTDQIGKGDRTRLFIHGCISPSDRTIENG